MSARECPACHSDYCRCVVPGFVGTMATREDLVAYIGRLEGAIPEALSDALLGYNVPASRIVAEFRTLLPAYVEAS